MYLQDRVFFFLLRVSAQIGKLAMFHRQEFYVQIWYFGNIVPYQTRLELYISVLECELV